MDVIKKIIVDGGSVKLRIVCPGCERTIELHEETTHCSMCDAQFEYLNIEAWTEFDSVYAPQINEFIAGLNPKDGPVPVKIGLEVVESDDPEIQLLGVLSAAISHFKKHAHLDDDDICRATTWLKNKCEVV